MDEHTLTPNPRTTIPGFQDGYVYRGLHITHNLRTDTWTSALTRYPSAEAAMQAIDDLAAPLPPRPLPSGLKVTLHAGQRAERASTGRHKADRAQHQPRHAGRFS